MTDIDALLKALGPRYVVLRRLGRGGMGVVYLALDVRLDRHVAVKILPGDRAGDAAARARFLREARTAASLSHPNIVPIHAVEEATDFAYYVMTYIEGETLGQRIRAGGALPSIEAIRIVRDVAWALAYAHARGIIHRDVKPDNILLEAATERALVTDFGIARLERAPSTTGPQRMLGTAEFMSPEQISGQPADGRSDIYSLGVVGFYLLTGRLPFTATDPEIVLRHHVSEPVPALRVVAPSTPHRIARLFERCLAKEPSARFARAEDLADALTQVLQERSAPPVAVRAFVTAGQHFAPWVRLYALIVGASITLAAAGEILGRPEAGVLILCAAGAVAASTIPFLGLVWRVRRFLSTGHDREDLVDFLQVQLQRRREELAFTYGTRVSSLEWVLRLLSYGLLAGAAATVWLAPEARRPLFFPALAAALAGTALVTALLSRFRRSQRTDPARRRRFRFWRGRAGTLIFRIAAMGRSEEGAAEPEAERLSPSSAMLAPVWLTPSPTDP